MMAGNRKAGLDSNPPKASPPAPRRLDSTFSVEAHPPATPGSQAPTLPDPSTPEERSRKDTVPIQVEDETPARQLPDNQEGDSQLYPPTQRDEKDAANQSQNDTDAHSEKSAPDTVHFPNPNSPVPSPSSAAGGQSPAKSEEETTPKTPPCEEETEPKNAEKKKKEQAPCAENAEKKKEQSPCEEETDLKNAEKKKKKEQAPPVRKSEPQNEYQDGSYWKILGLDSKTRT